MPYKQIHKCQRHVRRFAADSDTAIACKSYSNNSTTDLYLRRHALATGLGQRSDIIRVSFRWKIARLVKLNHFDSDTQSFTKLSLIKFQRTYDKISLKFDRNTSTEI